MKTVSHLCQGTRLLVLLGAVLVSSAAFASERSRVAPPQKVVHDIGAFFHRVGEGVKVASKKTWGAIRERFTDESDAASRSRRSGSSGRAPSQEDSSFARSKDAVPYRYDDADIFEANSGSDSNVNLAPRDPATNGPFTSPGEQMKPARSEDRKAFVDGPKPEAGEAQRQSAPLPENSASPKAAPTSNDGNIEFARPVAGKRGLVYPPGVPETPANLVDVGDFQSGQIVRDPRTGKLFRVP